MEIKNFVTPLLKWWWLLLLATLVAAGSSFMVVRQQPPEYEASATLMVGRTISDPNPTGNEFYLSQQLTGIYADIAQRDPVANAAMTALGLSGLPSYDARALPNSQFLEIAVIDTDPVRAQAVANELANQLILQSPTGSQQEEVDRQAFVNDQLDYLETKIEETKDDITQKQDELAEMVSARQIADTQQAITALQDKLTTLQANYASLLASTQSGAINIISVIEPAALPQYPIGPNVTMTVALAAAVGFVLAAGGAYLIEYLDDTLKTPEEITRLLDVPVLGTIAEAKELKPNAEEPILVLEQPYSPLTEAFRSLRTNLELAWKDGIPSTILVTSPGPGDGKTTIAVNLAAIMAMAGKRVFLVDADFRRPGVHNFLRIPNRLGLSDAILKDLRPGDVAHVIDDSRLKVVPCGTQIERPAEQLSSVQMLRALARFRDESDVTIFDSPAFLVADSLILASKLQAVLIVIQPGKTRVGEAQDMMEQLKRAEANVLGVVLNRSRRGHSPYYQSDYRKDGRRQGMTSRGMKTRRYPSKQRHKQLEEKQKEWKPPFSMD